MCSDCDCDSELQANMQRIELELNELIENSIDQIYEWENTDYSKAKKKGFFGTIGRTASTLFAKFNKLFRNELFSRK